MIKVSKIAKICKSNGEVTIYTVNGTQWIGTGKAMYPLYGMPEVNADTVKPVLSLTEKEAEKLVIEEGYMPGGISFEDFESDDIKLSAPILKFLLDDVQYSAYKVTEPTGETRAIILRDEYFKPFADCEVSAELIYRKTGGKGYIAVMDGLLLTGIVRESNIDSEKLAEQAGILAELLLMKS